MRVVGPIKIRWQEGLSEIIKVPLATFETPLWPSVNRGAALSCLTEGIQITLISDCMTRSVLIEAPDATYAHQVTTALKGFRGEMEAVVASTSRFASLENWHVQIVGKLIYMRFAFETGDAAGHNMTTKAADNLLAWILKKYPKLRYGSISGNFCTDKKVSAVNGILGRGKYVIAELIITKQDCEKILKTSPERIVELNIKKNLMGSIISGGLRTANAHFANMLLGFYLATGQDAANIIEGSQGIVHTEMLDSDLYFSVTLPNLILGTVGNGKQHDYVQKNLDMMGCLAPNNPGINAKRLSGILGATVLCGELSLLAAQTKPGELMKSHLRLERLERA